MCYVSNKCDWVINMDKNYTDILTYEIYELMNKPIPESVVIQAKKCLLDYLGTGLAGAVIAKEKCKKYLDLCGDVQDGATVVGYARKAALHNAAFINGYSAHITELDDGHRFSQVHLGTTVIPSVLAVAEYEKLSGKDLLRGIVIGYEAALRIGRAVQPSHKNRGFHVSGTAGTIGAAVGIAAALRYSKSELKAAISAGIAGAIGYLEVLEDDSELKPFNIGRAAHDGITAAYVARAGFKGPNDMLGGKRGFFAVMSDNYDPNSLNKSEEGVYGIEMIYRKPYAACRHCHAPIEAVLNIRNRDGIVGEDVREINVVTYQAAVLGHDYTEIKGITSAKMSTPYSVAVALETGRANLNEFLPKYIEDEKIKAITKKVRVKEDKNLSAVVPDKRAAIVEVIANNGQRYIERVDYPKGEPENSMSTEELGEKFISLAMYGGKTKEQAEEIAQLVLDIEYQLTVLYKML